MEMDQFHWDCRIQVVQFQCQGNMRGKYRLKKNIMKYERKWINVKGRKINLVYLDRYLMGQPMPQPIQTPIDTDNKIFDVFFVIKFRFFRVIPVEIKFLHHILKPKLCTKN